MFRIIFSLAAASILLAGPAAADEVLKGAEIRALLSDAKLKARAKNGRTYTIRYLADGTATLQMDDYSFADKGRWSVEGDASCSQWEKIRDGAKGCWDVFSRGGDDYFFRGRDGMRDVKAEVTR
jgi:hypothetical protein